MGLTLTRVHGAERFVIEAVNYNPVYNLLFTSYHAYVKKRHTNKSTVIAHC